MNYGVNMTEQPYLTQRPRTAAKKRKLESMIGAVGSLEEDSATINVVNIQLPLPIDTLQPIAAPATATVRTHQRKMRRIPAWSPSTAYSLHQRTANPDSSSSDSDNDSKDSEDESSNSESDEKHTPTARKRKK